MPNITGCAPIAEKYNVNPTAIPPLKEARDTARVVIVKA